MKSLLIQTVVLSIMVQIGAYRLPGLGHFRKSNEPHPTIEIGKFLYSLRNVHDLFKTSSNRMQGTRDGPTIPPSSQISINEGKTVISIGASEKKRSSLQESVFFSIPENFRKKLHNRPIFFVFYLQKLHKSNVGTFGPQKSYTI